MTLELVAEQVPVEDVRPGDVVRRPHGEAHVVVRVAGPYEDETRVVVYAAFEELTYENRARDHSGLNEQHRTVERSWIPLHPGKCVPVVRRGDAAALEEALDALRKEELARDVA